MKDWFRNIKWLFINLWTFRKTLWNFRPWDWTGYYQSMYDSLEAMEHQQRTYGVSLNSEKYADQIKVCRHLIERLIEDDYYTKDYEWPDPEYNNLSLREWMQITPKPKCSEQPPYRHSFKIRKANEQADRELLFKLLCKHSKSWWD